MKISKQLKKKIYENALKQDIYRGLCLCVSDSVIFWCENYVLVNYTKAEFGRAMQKDLRKNKPSFWKPRTWKFYFHESFTGNTFWWEGPDANSQRIKFLEYLIKKNS
jgi:hypothetical protein